MKINMIQDDSINEVNVDIRYPEMNDSVEGLERWISSYDKYIVGECEGRRYKINLHDIFYIETVDRRTFIYTKEAIYCSKNKLYMFKGELSDYDFVQINKACILNINVLESVKTLINSKMEATLINGEKLIISRSYISDLKKALEKEG